MVIMIIPFNSVEKFEKGCSISQVINKIRHMVTLIGYCPNRDQFTRLQDDHKRYALR